MANRYWVGGSATWNSTAASKWATTSGGAGGAAVPTAADDVFFDAASGAVTVFITVAGGSQVCRSLNCTGFTGTFNLDTSGLSIGDSGGGALTLSAGMTLTLANSPTFTFVSTSSNGGTGWGVTSAGKTLPAVTFNGAGGKWVLQDALDVQTHTLTLTNGTLDTNSKPVTVGVFSSNNTNSGRTLTLGSSSITVSGSSQALLLDAIGNGLTITANTATFTLTTTTASASANVRATTGSGNMNGASLTYSGFTTGTVQITNQCTWANMTFAPGATKSAVAQFVNGAVFTISGTLTMGGNTTQGVNRLLVQSNTLGTQRVITATGAAVVISGDVDFMDIGITGSPSWTNTGSKFVGDCGGNGTLITANITTPSTQTWNGTSGGNWSANAWTNRVPLPQDDVVISSAFSASQQVTADMPRLGKSINWTGTTGSPAWVRGAGITPFIFGSLTIVAGVGTLGSSTSTQWSLSGRSSYTISSAGKQWTDGLIISAPGGTYTLQDALSTTQNFTVNIGTFATNNNNVTCLQFVSNSSLTRTINLGTSTITAITTAATSSFAINTQGSAVWDAANATFVISTASANTRTVFGLPAPYSIGTLTYTVANSPGALLLDTNSSNFGTVNVGSGRILQITAAKNFNITNSFNVNGVANGYVYFPNASATNTFAKAPYNSAYDITGDIEMVFRLASDNWASGAVQSLMGRWDGAQSVRSYIAFIQTTGVLQFQTGDGTASTFSQNSSAPGFVNGTTYWIKYTFRPNDGAGNRVYSFYYANDQASEPSSWNLISTATVAGATSIFATTRALLVGASFEGSNGTNPFMGKMYRTILRNGIDGTVVFDADFTNRNAGTSNWLDAAKTQFTENSSTGATVTLNGLAQAGDGRVILNSSTPGSRGSLSKTSGIVSCSYLSIKDSAADGGASWHAVNSADAGNNTGWIFSSSPSTTSNFLIFGGMN